MIPSRGSQLCLCCNVRRPPAATIQLDLMQARRSHARTPLAPHADDGVDGRPGGVVDLLPPAAAQHAVVAGKRVQHAAAAGGGGGTGLSGVWWLGALP